MNDQHATSVAADYLEDNAEALVATWIEWVKNRVQTTTISALPERALRNHIPPVLRSLAQFLRNPVALARQDLLNHLRLHGQIRRDQGYALEEVLKAVNPEVACFWATHGGAELDLFFCAVAVASELNSSVPTLPR